MGSLRPRFFYDPATDPTQKKLDAFQMAVSNYLAMIESRGREERAETRSIFGAEVSGIKQKGLTVDAEQYFKDANYRSEVKRDEAAYDDIHKKSKAFSSSSRGSISPLIQSIGTTLDLYPDKTPTFVRDDDFLQLRRIILEGDEDLNQLAVVDLTEEEIQGIDGLEYELKRMGLWQDGEPWQAKDNLLGAREQIAKRFEWFEQGYKAENTNYVATESDAMLIAQREMQTQSAKLSFVREFQVVRDSEEADNNWITAQARLWKVNPEDENEIWDDDEKDYIDSTKYWGARHTIYTNIVGNSIKDLHEFKTKSLDDWNNMMARVQAEDPGVWATVGGLVNTYEQGRNLISKVEQDIDVGSYMDLQAAGLVKLEDLEKVQQDVAPIAQELAYLNLIKAGKVEPPSAFASGQLEKRISDLKYRLGYYYNYRQEQYGNREFSLRLEEMQDVFDSMQAQHFTNLYEQQGEKHPTERQQYFDAIQDLDYQNILNSIDLLIDREE